MPNPVVVCAARTPIGKRGGALSDAHPAALLGHVQRAVLDRSGLEAGSVDQVLAGCVTQSGAQGGNIARTSWLYAGLPQETGATTVDAQCGSSQQATHLAAALINVGAVRAAISCGVEVMSQIPLRAAVDAGPGKPRPDDWSIDLPNQFVGAERIAERFGFSRRDLDTWGVRSQTAANAAWAEGRYDREIVAWTQAAAPVTRDEGLRASDLEALGRLSPIVPEGRHTAATSSQLSDGAAAILLADADFAAAEGLQARATLRAQALVGDDPFLHLNGPVAATRKVLDSAALTVDDIDVFEVNEAFAAVALNWLRQTGAEEAKVNVNGGAIALGHPVGATGARLLTSALHELERTDGSLALVTMCTGGAMATATILERL